MRRALLGKEHSERNKSSAQKVFICNPPTGGLVLGSWRSDVRTRGKSVVMTVSRPLALIALIFVLTGCTAGPPMTACPDPDPDPNSPCATSHSHVGGS
jgi:hypothetical protein